MRNYSKTVKKSKKEAQQSLFTGSVGFHLVKRVIANKNIVIYKVNNAELFCAVELPLSDYKLYGKQIAAS